MTFNDYWHSRYDLGEKSSDGLVRLLNHLPSNMMFDRSLDIGCGSGRNFEAIKQKSKYLVGVEPNKVAYETAKQSKFVDEVECSTMQDYLNKNQKFNFIVGWRVLHLGFFNECQDNIDRLVDAIEPNGFLALAVSDRECPYYEKTRDEFGGMELEDGTILRTAKHNDIRHFFTYDELANINDRLNIIHHINFEERKGGNADKIKKYHAVFYKKW